MWKSGFFRLRALLVSMPEIDDPLRRHRRGGDAVEEMIGARHTTTLASSLFPSNSETT
jgi:hypothetical protein